MLSYEKKGDALHLSTETPVTLKEIERKPIPP
jgi:hypothetical protein